MQKASVQCKQVNFFTRVEQSLNLQLGEDCVEKVKDVFIYIPPQALNAIRHSENQSIMLRNHLFYYNCMCEKNVRQAINLLVLTAGCEHFCL